MKIITLQRLTDNGEPVYEEEGDTRDWFCVIETEEEELVYEKIFSGERGLGGQTYVEKLWDEMINHAGQGMGLHWGEDDIYGYFRPDETVPEVGEEWTDGDGDRWGRVE